MKGVPHQTGEFGARRMHAILHWRGFRAHQRAEASGRVHSFDGVPDRLSMAQLVRLAVGAVRSDLDGFRFRLEQNEA